MKGEMMNNEDVLAAMMAASADVDLFSCDRLEALTAGHGMVNMSVWAIANVITDELLAGRDISLKFSNTRTLPVDDVIAKCIAASKSAGAEAGNASLLTAAMLYLAGSQAHAGVPVGNRKLGALCRMASGGQRCGVAMIPTAKWGNKASGFPAVQAIYNAMVAGELTKVDGRKIPAGVTALFVGHAPLGEEHAILEVAKRAAAIGTKAMIEAQAGVGIIPELLYDAIFGAAATLEIVHPDAWTMEPDGTVIEDSPYLVGKAAAEAAGLPKQLTLEITGEVFDTAKFVGDFGLILKDVGAPTVVGVLCLRDLLQVFKENVSPYRPTTPPMGHSCAEAVLAMKALIAWEFDRPRVMRGLVDLWNTKRVDPEIAQVASNTMARKAEQVRRGPVSNLVIRASDPERTRVLLDRAVKSYEGLTSGKSLEEVVNGLELERRDRVEAGATMLLKAWTGKDITFDITKVAPRRHKKGMRGAWWVFDMDVDIAITVDGRTTSLSGLAQTCIPKAVLEGDAEMCSLVGIACLPAAELALSPHTILNITVPAAMAAVLGKATPEEAAATAEKAAFITAAIPGAREKALEVARRAIEIAGVLKTAD
jgi:hypothetical protein